jgi:hypothetical protein
MNTIDLDLDSVRGGADVPASASDLALLADLKNAATLDWCAKQSGDPEYSTSANKAWADLRAKMAAQQ